MAGFYRSRVAALVFVLGAGGTARAGDPEHLSVYIHIAGTNRHRDDHSREVVPTRPDLKLWNGRSNFTPRLSTTVYAVERTEGGQRLLRDSSLPAKRGWVPAGDVVPLKEAEGYFTAAIQAGDTRSFPFLSRGLVRYHVGENDLALADLNEALRRDPESVEALSWRASTHSAMHHRELAFADYDRALQLQPNNPHVLLCRSEIKPTSKQEIDRAFADLDRAIQIAPSEPIFRLNRAMCNIALKRRDAAIRDLQEIIRRFPESEPFLAAVVNLARIQEDRLAREAIRTRLAQHPDRDLAYRCHIVLALIDETEWRRSAARSELDAASAINPAKEDAYLLQAGMSRSHDDLRQAFLDMDAAIHANPSNGESHEARAVLYYHRHNYAAAIADMHTAAMLKPEDPEIHERLALMLASCAEASIRRGPEAVAEATRACELSRWKSPTALDALAAAEAESGHFLAAAGHEEKAIALLPDNDNREFHYRWLLGRYRDHKPAYRLSLLEEWGIRKSRRD